MNKTNKGRKAVAEFAEICENKFRMTVEKAKLVRFGPKDFFGIADLFGYDVGFWYLIQVKSNGTEGALKLLSQYWKEHKLPFRTRLIVAVRYDGINKGSPSYWKVHKYKPERNGWITVLLDKNGDEIVE